MSTNAFWRAAVIAACHSPKRLRSTLKPHLVETLPRFPLSRLKRSERGPHSLDRCVPRALSLMRLVSHGRIRGEANLRTSAVHNTDSPETFGTGPLIR
jgi:hypothetical protein